MSSPPLIFTPSPNPVTKSPASGSARAAIFHVSCPAPHTAHTGSAKPKLVIMLIAMFVAFAAALMRSRFHASFSLSPSFTNVTITCFAGHIARATIAGISSALLYGSSCRYLIVDFFHHVVRVVRIPSVEQQDVAFADRPRQIIALSVNRLVIAHADQACRVRIRQERLRGRENVSEIRVRPGPCGRIVPRAFPLREEAHVPVLFRQLLERFSRRQIAVPSERRIDIKKRGSPAAAAVLDFAPHLGEVVDVDLPRIEVFDRLMRSGVVHERQMLIVFDRRDSPVVCRERERAARAVLRPLQRELRAFVPCDLFAFDVYYSELHGEGLRTQREADRESGFADLSDEFV